MFPARAVLVALSVVALTAMQARAEEKEKEPDAIVEIGGSGNWSLSGPFSFGPTAAIEFTPIENWLEIEVGTIAGHFVAEEVPDFFCDQVGGFLVV